jgi:hypothetical protein
MSEGFVSRGFRGRHRQTQDTLLPPGQYLVDGFPVLSAGPTPHTPLEDWDFLIIGEVDEPKRWTWEEMLAEVAWDPEARPLAFVCGPTPLVEAVASALVKLGHDPARVKTERFGPTGG